MDLLAAIVSSSEAGFTCSADDIWLDRNTISNFEVVHRRMYSQYHTRRLVPQNMCILNDHGTNAASVPEVNIGSESLSVVLCENVSANLPADTSALNAHRYLSWFQRLPLLNLLERWRGLSNIQFMLRVGIDTNISLGGLHHSRDCFCC